MIESIIPLFPVFFFLLKINREIGELRTELKDLKESMKKQ